jgi:hypothetical protein
MSSRKFVLALALFACALGAVTRFQFYVWRIQHPQAPTWTFFFSR